MLELVPLCALTTRRSAVISRHFSLVHWLVDGGVLRLCCHNFTTGKRNLRTLNCRNKSLLTCEMCQSLSLIQVNHTYACHNSELLTKVGCDFWRAWHGFNSPRVTGRKHDFLRTFGASWDFQASWCLTGWPCIHRTGWADGGSAWRALQREGMDGWLNECWTCR